MTLFQVQAGSAEEIAVIIDSSSATPVVESASDVDGAWYVPWLQCNVDSGGTPALTVDLYDGTTAYLLGAGGVTYNAKALTAGQSVTFTDIVVPVGWALRVTSGDSAGKITVVGTKARRLG